jgi:hypothetical protein
VRLAWWRPREEHEDDDDDVSVPVPVDVESESLASLWRAERRDVCAWALSPLARTTCRRALWRCEGRFGVALVMTF